MSYTVEQVQLCKTLLSSLSLSSSTDSEGPSKQRKHHIPPDVSCSYIFMSMSYMYIFIILEHYSNNPQQSGHREAVKTQWTIHVSVLCLLLLHTITQCVDKYCMSLYNHFSLLKHHDGPAQAPSGTPQRLGWPVSEELESLMGLLKHTCKVIQPGRSFLMCMLDLIHWVHRSCGPFPTRASSTQHGLDMRLVLHLCTRLLWNAAMTSVHSTPSPAHSR